MSCIAVWFSLRSPEDKSALSTMEVHFNFWRPRNRKFRQIKQCMDIGLMVEETINIASIYVYLPFVVTEKIEDLGAKLESTSSLQAVFNEPWRSLADPGITTIDVVDFEKAKLFQIYRISEEDIKIQTAYDGSMLQLVLPDGIHNKTYFRFRIYANTLSPIIKEDKPSNSWLESAFFVTETVDFHLNEKRNLPEDLLRTLHTAGEVVFTKTHLFLMRPDNFDHTFSYPSPVDSRTLEPKIWIDYLGPQYSSERIIAYHWKQKINDTAVFDKNIDHMGFKSFNVFTKFRYQSASITTIIIFISILLAISFAGSLVAAWLFKLISPS